MGIDLYGRLPYTAAGNRWAIVAFGHFTRYAETAALPAAIAQDVALFLLQRFTLWPSAPQELLSARGCLLLPEIVETLPAECRIAHWTCTAYHPPTNRLTEQFNHTLGDMLAMYDRQIILTGTWSYLCQVSLQYCHTVYYRLPAVFSSVRPRSGLAPRHHCPLPS